MAVGTCIYRNRQSACEHPAGRYVVCPAHLHFICRQVFWWLQRKNNSRLFRDFFQKIYCCSVPHAHATESGMSLVEFFMIFFQEPNLTAVQAAALLKHSMISGCCSGNGRFSMITCLKTLLSPIRLSNRISSIDKADRFFWKKARKLSTSDITRAYNWIYCV